MDAIEFLEHHGVKGMKWGVRKDRGHEGERTKTKKIVKLDKRYERNASGLHGYIAVNNAFAKHLNPMLDELNVHPKYAGKDLYANKKLHTAYWNDIEKLMDKAAKKATEELGPNASGTKHLKVTREGFGENATWKAELVDIKHADGLTSFKIIPIVDANGMVTSLEFKQDVLQQADDLIENALGHHGVKGMRWGVRKNHSDGTPVSVTLRTSSKNGQVHGARGGENHPAHEDAVKAILSGQKARKSGTNALSNKELQDLVSRMNLEQQYRRLAPQTTSQKSAKFVSDVLVNVGKQQASKLASDFATQEVAKRLKR